MMSCKVAVLVRHILILDIINLINQVDILQSLKVSCKTLRILSLFTLISIGTLKTYSLLTVIPLVFNSSFTVTNIFLLIALFTLTLLTNTNVLNNSHSFHSSNGSFNTCKTFNFLDFFLSLINFNLSLFLIFLAFSTVCSLSSTNTLFHVTGSLIKCPLNNLI